MARRADVPLGNYLLTYLLTYLLCCGCGGVRYDTIVVPYVNDGTGRQRGGRQRTRRAGQPGRGIGAMVGGGRRANGAQGDVM